MRDTPKNNINNNGVLISQRISFAYDAAGNRVKKEYRKDNESLPDGLEDPEEITTPGMRAMRKGLCH